MPLLAVAARVVELPEPVFANSRFRVPCAEVVEALAERLDVGA